jgi:Hedgehog amino-terminal signalling domain.
MAPVFVTLEDVFDDLGYDVTITSGTEGDHAEESFHYNGLAIDVRTRDLTQQEAKGARSILEDALNQEYDVVLEKDHIHIEFDNGIEKPRKKEDRV